MELLICVRVVGGYKMNHALNEFLFCVLSICGPSFALMKLLYLVLVPS